MENEMKFIGLDLSLTNTGCFLKTSDRAKYESKLICTKPDQFENSILRCEHISLSILEFINLHKPTMVTIEDYFAGKMMGSVIQLAELGTLVRYILIKNKIGFYTVAPMQLKKFGTGKGNCEKDVIMKYIFKKWNVDVNNNNIADACVLAYVAEAIFKIKNSMSIDLADYEKEVVTKILKERKMF